MRRAWIVLALVGVLAGACKDIDTAEEPATLDPRGLDDERDVKD